jgi:hypothetical protein
MQNKRKLLMDSCCFFCGITLLCCFLKFVDEVALEDMTRMVVADVGCCECCFEACSQL